MKLYRVAVFLVLALPLPASIFGCSILTPKNAKTALEIGKATCIAARVFLPREEVIKACDILEAEAPLMDQLLSAQKASMQRYSSTLCGTGDAGRD